MAPLARGWQGRSDPVDADAGARPALAQRRTGMPKQREAEWRPCGILRVVRRSAIHQRADVSRQMKTLIITVRRNYAAFCGTWETGR
ncbi:hypothetical protein [Streptomyces dysideae]|uniref:Uncharacterized protein n=1 Tax=Streptomyces dysideae TaxID=909626 RepID=A0A101UWC0_9ACTN|nr:hypothetical protein [Streptomyces dysideae]KUO18057.1 hypothetical protein AQJ91_27035 [Streptomyces dysideae]